MVKIKLPKSLRKVFFPKRKSSSSSSSAMTVSARKSFKEGVSSISSCAAIPSTPPESAASNIKKQDQSFHDFRKVVNAAEESTEGGSPVTVGTMMSSGSSQQQGEEEEMMGHQQQQADSMPTDTPRRSNIGQQRSTGSISPISPILLIPSVKPQEPDVSSDTLPYSPLADIGNIGDVIIVKEEETRQEIITAMTSSPISKMSAFDVVKTQEVTVINTATLSTASSSSSNPKKGQFSTRGEEARKRAVARQKKILSKASLRLDAISDMSLEAQAKTSPEITLSKELGKQDVAGVATFSNSKESEQMGCEVPREEYSNEEVAIGRGETAGLVPIDQICSTASGKNGVTDAAPVKLSARRQSLEVEHDLKAMEKGSSVSSMINMFESPTTNNLFGQKKEPISPILEEQAEQHQPVDASQSKPSQGVVRSTEQEPSKNTIQFFILLLCPTSRVFELIEISAADTPRNESTIHDILNLIPQKCTDERLVNKSYVGFVRPSDRVDFLDLQSKAFGEEVVNEEEGRDHWPSLNAIHEKDVLVAILEDYSGYQMSKISKPIVRNSKFRKMIRRRCKSGRGSKGSKCNGRKNSEERSTRSNRSTKSSSSRRRRHRGSRRSNAKGDSASSKSNRTVPVVSCVPGKIDSHRNESSGVVSGVSFGKNTRTERSSSLKEGSNNDEKESSRYSSLCQKLEFLSKKLHDVDDEIVAEDESTVGGKFPTAAKDADASAEGAAAVADNTTETTAEEDLPLPEANFKMTTQMMANEISASIEDIFADHDVEIVAVDEEDDSDADTFATAQSKRSVKSMRSARSIVRGFEPLVISSSGISENVKSSKPLLEITTKKKASRKMRKNHPSKFESYEDDDMMLQIEAMARQADAVFESRKMKPSEGGAGTTIIEPGIDSAIAEPKIRVIEERINVDEIDVIPEVPKNVNDTLEVDNDLKETLINKERAQQAPVSFDNEMKVTTSDLLGTIKSMTNGEDSSIGASNTLENAVSTYTAHSNRDTLSRNFLDASTSMVTTMVTASQGRVNEVHVLQYLGVTIVCVAANFMQQQQGGTSQGQQDFFTSRRKRHSFGADVLQSAMFLAFMVNGQRYLAKVTKKSV